MSTIAIREMESGDLRELSAVYVHSFYSAEEPWTEETASALLTDWFKRQPDLSFVAVTDAKIVGALLVGIRPWCDGNHLVDGEIFVLPEYQKMGIAGKLMRTTLEKAIANYNPVVWETYTFRARAFPYDWYQKLGFKEIEEWMMIRAEIADLATALHCYSANQ